MRHRQINIIRFEKKGLQIIFLQISLVVKNFPRDKDKRRKKRKVAFDEKSSYLRKKKKITATESSYFALIRTRSRYFEIVTFGLEPIQKANNEKVLQF